MAFDGTTNPQATRSLAHDLTRLGADRVLILVAGACAIGFGALALILFALGEPVPRSPFVGYSATGSAIFSFSIAAVFGLGLLLAYGGMRERPVDGSILALAFSIVLLAFGALPGLIAGIVDLVGALTGVVRHLRFSP